MMMTKSWHPMALNGGAADPQDAACGETTAATDIIVEPDPLPESVPIIVEDDLPDPVVNNSDPISASSFPAASSTVPGEVVGNTSSPFAMDIRLQHEQLAKEYGIQPNLLDDASGEELFSTAVLQLYGALPHSLQKLLLSLRILSLADWRRSHANLDSKSRLCARTTCPSPCIWVVHWILACCSSSRRSFPGSSLCYIFYWMEASSLRLSILP